MGRRTVTLIAIVMLTGHAMAEDVIPLPRQKPAVAKETRAAMIPIPRANPRRSEHARETPPPASGPCMARLKALDVTYEALSAIREGRCGAPAPLLVSGVAGVTLDPPATLTCEMTEHLHAWVSDVVQPAAKRRLKTRVEAIKVAASYVCRLRNNQSTGKLSEHAKANALDMAGFQFGTAKDVKIGDGWGAIAASLGLSRTDSFLGDLRKGACTHFTTVLGPGSDPFHGDHFHVDALERRGGYRICK